MTSGKARRHDGDAPSPPPRGAYADGGKVHSAVVEAIGGMVMGRRFAPGDALPREDALAAELGVSRTSVREAVKVLSAKGLVEARPRTGLRVRPRAEWNILDPAVLSWHADLAGDRPLMDDLIEARRVIEPPAAGLAARRASAADVARIEAAYLAMEASIPDDLARCCEADVAFHRAVVAASRNAVLAALSGTVETALRAVFRITNRLMDRQSEALAAHGEVLERIRLRDEPAAVVAMHGLLDVAARDLGPGRD